jgi:hypothetical protein
MFKSEGMITAQRALPTVHKTNKIQKRAEPKERDIELLINNNNNKLYSCVMCSGSEILSWSNQSATYEYVRFEIFTAVTMKNAVYWDVTPCGSCRDRCFGGTYRLHHQGDKNNVSSN